MNKRLIAAAVAAACSVPSFAFGNEARIPPIIVTASRTAQTADEALAAVTVIDREEIERRQATSLPDLLRGTPGLTITNNGGPGKASAVFLRGTESDHVLVLIDGIKLGSSTVAGVAWQDLPLDQIERIEVVRGPRSSLYGSEAIGGVIQIFTRKGGGKTRASASVGGGSDDTYQAIANLSGGGKRGWFSLGTSHIDTKGFNSCIGSLSGGCFANEPDDDGYRRSAVQARAGTRFGATGEADISALRAWGHTEFDGFYNANDFVEQVIGGRVSFLPLEPWRVTLTAGNNRNERDYFQNGTFMSDIQTTRDVYSWQNDLSLGRDHLLTLGVDHQRDEVDGSTAYTVDSRDNTAVFAQYQAEFGRHSLLLAGRHDDNEQFGEHDTGNVGWGYAWSPELNLFASYGTAFKAPNFDDLYSPWGGNPELDPERSRSAEIGLRGRARAVDWGVYVFRTEVDDLIALDSSFEPYNVQEARIDGLEATATTRLFGWTATANLTLLDPKNRTADDNEGNLLPRRSRRSARLAFDRNFGAVSVGGSIFAESRRYDDLANTHELGGYGVVDLRAAYAFARNWRIEGEIGNAFDKDYQTAAFFNQAGRTYFVSLHYAPTRD